MQLTIAADLHSADVSVATNTEMPKIYDSESELKP